MEDDVAIPDDLVEDGEEYYRGHELGSLGCWGWGVVKCMCVYV